MKKLFTLFLLAFSLSVMAQDAYEEAVRSYFENSFSTTKPESLPAEYVGEFYKIAIEEFQANGVTIDDLKKFEKIRFSEAGKTYAEHVSQFNDGAMKEQVLNILMPSLQSIITTGKAEPIDISSIPTSYQKKYHAFFDTSEAKSSLKQISNVLQTALSSSEQSQVESFISFLQEEGENMMMKVSYGYITDDDLTFITKFNTSKSGKRISKASYGILEKFITYLLKL